MSTAAQTRPISESSHPSATALISPDNYSFLQRYIYRQSGIVLDSGKHYLVEARLMPIVREQKLESLDELCGRIRSRSSVALEQVVVEAMTTNETLFFRDMAPFEALRQPHYSPTQGTVGRRPQIEHMVCRRIFGSGGLQSGHDAVGVGIEPLEH